VRPVGGEGCIEGVLQQCADLGLEAAAQHVRAVVIDDEREVPAGTAGVVLPRLFEAVHPPPCSHDLLDLRGRAVLRDVEQRVLVRRRPDARDRARLRVRQFAAPQRVADERQLDEGTRHAHFLPRRAQVDARAPAQPVRAAAEAARPTFAHVELVQPDEQAVRGRVQVRGELRDLVAQTLEVGAPRGPAFDVSALGRPTFQVGALGRPVFDVSALGRPTFEVGALGRPAFDVGACGRPTRGRRILCGRNRVTVTCKRDHEGSSEIWRAIVAVKI
jgi:hypothetical protein